VRSGAGDGLDHCYVHQLVSTPQRLHRVARPRRELLKMQPVLLAPIADVHEGALSHVRHFPWTLAVHMHAQDCSWSSWRSSVHVGVILMSVLSLPINGLSPLQMSVQMKG
jgi:hypothetical protein